MKKEILKYLFGVVSKNGNIGKNLLIFGSICLVLLFITIGTGGYIFYRVVDGLWRSDASTQIQGILSETLKDSKDAIANGQINTPSCLQKIKDSISLNTILNLESSIQGIKDVCFNNTPKESNDVERAIAA